MTFLDLTGLRYGHLVVISRLAGRQGGGTRWLVQCDCGNAKEVDGANLRYGRTKSCGCQQVSGAALRTRHGLSKTKTHNVWVGMRQRCENPANPVFEHYGGRGISVCERWKVFENFLADMGIAPAGKSIERVDNHKNYEPGNCIWANQLDQVKNRRNSLSHEFQGVIKSLKEWADHTGLPYKTLYHRFSIGERGELLFRPLRRQT